MPLLKAGQIQADPWRHLADDAADEPGAAVTISLARWLKERDFWRARAGSLGLRVPNDAAIDGLADDIARFDLIALSFPRFADGRAYSQARLLRDRLHYTGELRASGNVLRDQLLFMQRCGIDAYDLPDRALTEDWLSAFGEMDVFYQPAEDHRPWVLRQRLSG